MAYTANIPFGNVGFSRRSVLLAGPFAACELEARPPWGFAAKENSGGVLFLRKGRLAQWGDSADLAGI